MTRGLFVTGTDTGAGKTLVSRAILRALGRRGLRVAACKPVETGCRDDNGDGLVGEDCARLAAAAQRGQSARDVAAYLLREPAAPLVAAEAEGVAIEPPRLLQHFEAIACSADFVLVEGAGGLLVPVAPGYTTRDLARDIGLPVLCVVASRLGCINHALLTLEALAGAGITLAGYVMNEIAAGGGDYSLALRSNRETIARFTSARHLGAMPFVEDWRSDDDEHLADLAEAHLELDALL